MAGPLLDVDDVLLDPDFCEPLAILRPDLTLSQHGRNAIAEYQVTPPPIGVVIPGAKGFNRTDVAEITGAMVTVWVYGFTFLPPNSASHPDVLLWRGTRYVLQQVNDWSRYGRGFNVGLFSVMDPISQADNGQADFTQAGNSSLVAAIGG